MPDWYSQPPTLLALIFLALGFFALIKGADIMVGAAVAIARRTGLSTAVIGATVVAFGTSLPELVVSITSMLQAERMDHPATADIALSNVVGSNIFNIGLILGLSALWRPLPVPPSSIRLDYPLMLLASFALILMSIPWDGGPAVISRWQGMVLCAGLLAFIFLSLRQGRVDADEIAEVEMRGLGLPAAAGLVLLGILLMTLGGEVALTGAVQLATVAGLSERVIGLTVIALGTSLPELATSIQAARRGETAIAVANIIGSNLFNILCIVGVASLVIPMPVSSGTLSWDYWWMMGFILVLLPLMLRGRIIRRGEGILLLSGLVVYIATLLIWP
ncbi:MAG: sodium:calcium antiporter [Planctomycetota bacterium]|nr:MAG: sodium:calcium antiporter [Planctomycetota bacterium]